MNRRRIWLLASAALTLAVVANWWLSHGRDTDRDTDDRPGVAFDYALSDFDAVLFDEQGQVSLRVRGPRLEHVPETRRAHLQQPRFEVPGDEATWDGRADRGTLARDDETLWLDGNVVLTRPHERGEVRVETEALRYDRTAARVESDRPTRFMQAGHELVGGTLVYLLNDDRLELQDDVHAIYRDAADDPADRTGDPRPERSGDADPGAGR